MNRNRFIYKKNRGYEWFNYKETFIKGYLILDDTDCILRGNELAKYVEERVNTVLELKKLLQSSDGCFAIVKLTSERMLAAVDRARTIPIYYNLEGEILSDSCEEIRIILGISKNAVDSSALYEFQQSDYVEFGNTMYSSIKQIEAGQLLYKNNSMLKTDFYYRHLNMICNAPEENIRKELWNISYKTFYQIKKIIDGRPVVLSLSGGYDSRYIATMLKNVGVDNVKCYTYGKADSFEVKESKAVAEALGYEWKSVVYSDEIIADAVNDEQYFEYCNEHDYTLYLQNYPAVKQLHNEGWFEPDSVFLTGLCGDMPTGNYVQPANNNLQYNLHTAAVRLFNSKFTRSKVPTLTGNYYLERYKDAISEIGIEIKDYQSYVQAVDCIATTGQHSRCFLHMNRAHEFFGFEWLLPFWNKNLLGFWYSLPFKYRVQQNLYESFIVDELCKPYGIGTLKYRATYSKNRSIRKIKYLVGSLLVRIFFSTGHAFRRKYDYNNFAYGEYLLFSKLRNRKNFNYKKAGFPYILNRYICEKRHYE